MRKNKLLEENFIDFNGSRFVNIIGLFGSNAAGKSNLIKAVATCRQMILTSHIINPTEEIKIEPFKFAANDSSEFYIDFVCDGVEYEYSFEIRQGVIINEDLYYYPHKRKARIFSRYDTDKYIYGKSLIRRPSEIEINTGPGTLFLSRGSSMNREILEKVYTFFLHHIVIGTGVSGIQDISRECFERNKHLLVQALTISDSDISDIEWREEVSGRPHLVSFHKENPAIAFDFEREESDGTKRLIFILLRLIMGMSQDITMFIDEFDLKLHLRLAEFILDVIRASRGMQIVFTSHNPYLIDVEHLSPEQIVFVTKLPDGNSEFAPLSDFEGLREIGDIRKAYLQGRFDGVPYIGNIKPVIKFSKRETGDEDTEIQ